MWERMFTSMRNDGGRDVSRKSETGIDRAGSEKWK